MPAAAGIRFAEMRPELFGSLSASFERFLEDALAASKQARCLLFNQGKLSFPTLRNRQEPVAI
ncbi:hypothetical protein [Bacillus velezensis]|uniref:hypothetical protein n=1 Tax=Bacillus velezensis TaxID=492670 RepID=UPI0006A8F411|nr:hypothetical protein [Bacillus velezensis]CUB45869.1 hypothetical protein BN2127_JRS8_03555 [Bacillus amyloliquefaciens]